MSTNQSPQGGTSRVARAAKIYIIVVWALLAGGVVLIAMAGPPPLALAAVVGGIACLAGAFVIPYRVFERYGPGHDWKIHGQELTLLLALCAVSIGLMFLFAALD
ncbi:hypothetical protein [Arthrobacter pityocampae]|uniref:hypothetical protein n=1 Tax=Arthrobacter pityocampae TaxID=547334 RepID=UPI003734C26A